MLRFKGIILCIHALLLTLCFLPTIWGSVVLFVSFLFLAYYLKRFLLPLEKIMTGTFPLPIEKNAFMQLALSMNAMSEKIKEGKLQSQGQDKDLEGILNSLNEGIIAFNVRSKITFVNPKACQMLGFPKQELIGRSLLYFGGFLLKCHEMVLHALQTAESAHEKWIREGVHFDLLAAPLMHQEGAILVIQDKTSDYKILELGKTFIANASHEIRTPITVIRGFAELLHDQNISPVKTEEITEKIVSTCDRLDKLVKSLLTLSDLENFSTDRFRPCHLGTLIEHCRHLLETAYPDSKIFVPSIKENLTVNGDFDLLSSALMNVLENAMKYSHSEPIQIKIQQAPDTVQIRIEDHGIGIPASDLPHVFDRFYTVDKARSRKSGGVGLGLSIVKLIMEKHKGTVSAQSELGKGSAFTLELPSH